MHLLGKNNHSQNNDKNDMALKKLNLGGAGKIYEIDDSMFSKAKIEAERAFGYFEMLKGFDN
ncbi:hypothetical protein BpHYR1_049147 [Brachionus plicatilis]|uniref:Uncharacterized protein n=1 Tax=Brachionus plicatilis TaxID=10195 RepID=A0A3M7SKT1_BRAPC|nr:hypothetical protein BpHYR1_049147 [Brachionus plicatilis]